MSTGTQVAPSPAKWEIMTIEVTEPDGAVLPGNIVKQGDPCFVTMKFKGEGAGYEAYANLKADFKVKFFVESVGEGPEFSFEAAPGELAPGTLEYEVKAQLNTALPEGLYTLGCAITFPEIPGMVGFIEGVLLQIYV